MSGYTKVDNNLLEEVYIRKFSANELPIILLLWRSTYGWQKESHDMGLTYISDKTGIDKKAVKRAIDSLIENKVILVVKEANYNNSRVLAFNRNFEEWTTVKRGQKTLQSPNLPTGEGSKNPTVQSSFLPTGESPNLPPIKESIKENIKKNKENLQDFSLERPEHWEKPKPVTKDELSSIRKLEEELDF